ncbi:unnamed protein product [Didymodactylos carnosus]|uniref:Choline/carnitine acyltransferase domain-containing protein n=1 Tax=Didymodactylos carnosus TaxID=1234261 RepID=A0A815N551_9BILA|nr:unnamed protein product [Didymodactylos carnosus]CAF1429350.1 unnamed protein product [Didymodactylos carnosus]CAF3569731.1 unnamed protein product [Didymodactylos carnosus]CAF4308585.1 unnamed protein product [Didymodactylos carnosus]
MEQYLHIFKSFRVPGVEKDHVYPYKTETQPSKNEHIIVVYQNVFYTLDVVIDYQEINEENIYLSLKNIVKMTNENSDHGIGILTTLPRRMWGTIRMDLLKKENLQKLLSCQNETIMLPARCWSFQLPVRSLVLDEVHCGKAGQNYDWLNRETTLFVIALLMCPLEKVIVSSNGTWGLNIEHSLIDGIVSQKIAEYLYRYV